VSNQVLVLILILPLCLNPTNCRKIADELAIEVNFLLNFLCEANSKKINQEQMGEVYLHLVV